MSSRSVDDPERWLGATRTLDLGHPAVARVAAALVKAHPDRRSRAAAAHAHVSRGIRFGFRPAFYAMTASQVLSAGVGYCNTQSTAFVALLRAMGIPARAHFVDISADVLSGVLTPGTPYVDHCWTEVWLDGSWQRTDAYIVDPPLLAAAKVRLAREERALGFGAHFHGTDRWDGRGDAFSQWLNDGAHPRLSTRDYGPYDDATAFYAQAGERWNRLNPMLSLALLLGGSGIDSRIEAVRRGR